MLQALPHTPTLLIASVPWLVARTLIFRGTLVLWVNRSIEIPEAHDMYQPVAKFLEQHQHSVQYGPVEVEDEDMAGCRSVTTIYRLAVP